MVIGAVLALWLLGSGAARVSEALTERPPFRMVEDLTPTAAAGPAVSSSGPAPCVIASMSRVSSASISPMRGPISLTRLKPSIDIVL